VDDSEGAASVALLLDTSASMRNEAKLTRALAATIILLNRLDDQDEVVAYTFGEEVRRLQPAGSVGDVREGLIQVLDGLFAEGEPMLYDALCQAARDLSALGEIAEAAGEERTYIILLFTDGKDSGIGAVRQPTEARNCLPSEQVRVYTIGLGEDADSDFLDQVTEETGGQSSSASSENLIDIFSTLTFIH